MSAREQAYQLLLRFNESHGRLDELLDGGQVSGKLNPRDRKLLRNLVSGVVRHRTLLDWHIDHYYAGKASKMLNKTRVLLRMAFYELIFLDHIPPRASVNEYAGIAGKRMGERIKRLVNGMLRTYLRSSDEAEQELDKLDGVERLRVRYSFPEWLIRRWLGFWSSEEVEELCRGLNERPVFDVRINENKITVDSFREKLREAGIVFVPSSRFRNMVTITDVQAFLAGGWLEQGYASVQDESAALPVLLMDIRPQDSVLDLCAAPGGKFTQILEHREEGLTVAVDSDLNRLKRVRENSIRLGFKNPYCVNADGRNLPFKKKFTRILLDAPCSGLGVIGKNPDIKWRRSMQEIVGFSVLQKELLNSALEALAEDGQLVYSTCTIDVFENEQVTGNALKEHKDEIRLQSIPQTFREFEESSLIKTYPHRHDMDGSFAAILQKIRKK